MPLALCLIVAFALGGTSLTYLYDGRSNILERLAIGTAAGLAGMGLLGLGIALILGLGPACLILTVAISTLSFLVLVDRARRQTAASDIACGLKSIVRVLKFESVQDSIVALAYVGLLVVLFLAFKDALFYRDSAVFTGVQNDYGDVMLHLSVIARFSKGGNFPPMDPGFSGVRFTYPFLSDFISAMLVKAGAGFRAAMFLEGFSLASAMLVLLHRWAVAFSGTKIAGAIGVFIVFFSGGLGWVSFIDDGLHSGVSFSQFLLHLPHDYTITDVTFRWANSVTSLLIPQRSLLLGAPLALIVFTIFWQNWRKGEPVAPDAGKNRKAEAADTDRSVDGAESHRREWPMIGAGVIAGILPLAHTHTFLVVIGVAVILALSDREWRGWARFFFASLLLAAPQLWWLSGAKSVDFGTFFQFHLGWNSQGANPIFFWLANTGVLIPLLLAALFWPGEKLTTKRQRLFYLPFALCFIIPNIAKLAPWEWDNIKVLFYWLLGSAPLVGAALGWIWNRGWSLRVIVIVLVCSLTLAGALDLWRVVSGASQFVELTGDDLAFAHAVQAVTAPNSLIVHAPIHNDPIMLTGRQSFIGYPGHLWTRGIDPYERVDEVKAIYEGGPQAESLISQFGIQYAVVSHAEESTMPVNADFFRKFNLVVQIGSYSLYKLQ